MKGRRENGKVGIVKRVEIKRERRSGRGWDVVKRQFGDFWKGRGNERGRQRREGKGL